MKLSIMKAITFLLKTSPRLNPLDILKEVVLSLTKGRNRILSRWRTIVKKLMQTLQHLQLSLPLWQRSVLPDSSLTFREFRQEVGNLMSCPMEFMDLTVEGTLYYAAMPRDESNNLLIEYQSGEWFYTPQGDVSSPGEACLVHARRRALSRRTA